MFHKNPSTLEGFLWKVPTAYDMLVVAAISTFRVSSLGFRFLQLEYKLRKSFIKI